MKNILVISEVFKRGGLETQIYTFYKELNKKLNFTFIFGEYNNEWDFGKSKIYTDIKFNDKSSINDFKKTVNEMIKIIKDNKIDVIHTHPFHLAIPAVFAAEITKTPIVYTYHGFLSYTYPNSINIQTIFNYSLNELFSKIFCVMKPIADSLNEKLRNTEAVFLPNPIEMREQITIPSNNNGKWAMTCRLDSDKLDTITDIICSLKELNINELHIYGSGNSEDKIKDLIKAKRLKNRVFLDGYTNDVYKTLKDNYTGLIGVGRSVGEGIAMGMPTVLAGLGVNCGLVDKNNYEVIKDNNFTTVFFKSENNKNIGKQIKDINENGYTSDIYDMFKEDCSAPNVSKRYLEELNSVEVNVISNFIYFYKDIEKIDSDECFATSDKIYNLIYKYLKKQSLDSSLNTTMVYYNSIQKQIKELNSKLSKMDEKNKKTIEKINIKYMFKNTFKILKKKIKK